MDQASFSGLAARIYKATRLRCPFRNHGDWLGLLTHDIKSAIWLMRALVVGNVLARREDNIVLAAVNPITDPRGDTLAQRAILAYRYGVERNIFP